MTTKEKINQYLNLKGISPTKAEVMLNWGKGALTKSSSMSTDKLEELLLLFDDLSAEWLLRGSGEMIKENNANKEIPQSFDAKVEIDEEGCLNKEIKICAGNHL